NTTPGASVTILYGNGFGGFAPSSAIPVAYGFNVVVGDLNADARADIVADGCALLNGGSSLAATSFSARQVESAALAGTTRSVLHAAYASPSFEDARAMNKTRSGTLHPGTASGPTASSVSAFSMTNPLRGSGMLSFELRKAGPVTVRLFDLSGRVAKTVKH